MTRIQIIKDQENARMAQAEKRSIVVTKTKITKDEKADMMKRIFG